MRPFKAAVPVVCEPKDEDGGKHNVHQNNRLLAPAVSTRSKTTKWGATHPQIHQSIAALAPNSSFQSERSYFLIALTDWVSLQLVSSFINYCVLFERSFAKLWWSAHSYSQKCCSHYLLARSRLDSISFIYLTAGKWAVVLVHNELSSIFIYWYTNHGSRWL